MYKELIAQRKKDFEAAFEFAKSEAAGIRTGRASASLVENIPVEYLGTRLTVKELASITTPEPRSLVIQPWDKGALAAIEKGIRDSSLGLNPVVDSTSVRLNIPQLTEERRREFLKLLSQKIEEARVRIRQIREEILKKVQAAVREKSAREDDLRLTKDELQKVVDDLHRRLEEIAKKKEQELLSL